MHLDEMDFAGDDFAALRSCAIDIFGDDRGPNNRRTTTEIELDCDYNLRYENVINAINAVACYADDNGNAVQWMERIHFSPAKLPPRRKLPKAARTRSVRPPRSELIRSPEPPYEEQITVIMRNTGNVFVHGASLPLAAMPRRMMMEREILRSMGRSASDATVIIRADEDCLIGEIHDLIRICTNERFQRFVLRLRMKKRYYPKSQNF
jgi:hypothetical protein